MATKNQRRKNGRIAIHEKKIQVDLVVNDKTIFSSCILNVSISGIALELKKTLPEDCNVKILFHDKTARKKFQIPCEMIWRQKNDLNKKFPQSIGLIFSNPTEESIQYLMGFLRNVLAHYTREQVLDKMMEIFADGYHLQKDFDDYYESIRDQFEDKGKKKSA